MATTTKKKPAAQKSPEVHVSLGTFDTGPPVLRIARTTKLANFEWMTALDYCPRGGTPLRDAVAQFVGHLDSLRREDRVVVGMLADESGSMSHNREAVISGFNDFVAGLAEVEVVDPESAGKVLCVIFTDGYENASRETTPEGLAALMAAREADGWSFIFMGANIDAWGTGTQMGLSAGASGQTVNFVSTPGGTRSAMGEASHRSAMYLSSNASYAALDSLGSTNVAEDGTVTPDQQAAALTDQQAAPVPPVATRSGDVTDAINSLKGRS